LRGLGLESEKRTKMQILKNLGLNCKIKKRRKIGLFLEFKKEIELFLRIKKKLGRICNKV